MKALDNIKAALEAGPQSRTALEVWRATQPYQGATEKQERAFLAGYKEGRDAAIRELLAYVESLEKDAARWRAMRECLLGVDWAFQDDPDCSAAIFICPRDVQVYAGPECADQIADAVIDAAMEQTK